MNIVLIGMRGSGKSNLSRRLSVLTKRPVLSTDLLISLDAGGRSIPQILADHGGDWRPFREMEYAVIRKTAAMDGLIIDAGGGVVVDLDAAGDEVFSDRKVSLLKQNGHIIWLKGDIPRLAAKVAADAGRPALSARHDAEALMRRRLPFYQQAADWVVDIEGDSWKNLARKNLARQIHERLTSILVTAS